MLGHTDKGTLGLVLLDADFDQSARVIDRLVVADRDLQVSDRAADRRSAPPAIPPTPIDADSLKRQALSQAAGELARRLEPVSPIRTEVTLP